MTLAPGLRASLLIMVEHGDTAAAVGSGDVPVLATPRLLALAETATVQALRGRLRPGETSVGTRVELEHLAASPVGDQVEVTVELTEVAGRRLVFRFEAHGGAAPTAGETVPAGETVLVGRGTIERMVLD